MCSMIVGVVALHEEMPLGAFPLGFLGWYGVYVVFATVGTPERQGQLCVVFLLITLFGHMQWFRTLFPIARISWSARGRTRLSL